MVPESIFATLGVAAPLVAILYYLLRQATDERKDVTKQFLGAITETVAKSTEAMQRLQESSRIQEMQRSEEHRQMLDALKIIADESKGVMRPGQAPQERREREPR